MSINRMPLFCWAVLATSLSIVFAIPSLTRRDCLLLELERRWGFHFFDTAGGGDPLLWQHLFWIFGHPDVYIIFLPAVGIVSSIVPVFSRRPLVAYDWVALATMATALLGFGVWVHHMFAAGLPQVSLRVLRGGEHDHRDPERDPGLRLARDDADGPARAPDAVPLRARLPRRRS